MPQWLYSVCLTSTIGSCSQFATMLHVAVTSLLGELAIWWVATTVKQFMGLRSQEGFVQTTWICVLDNKPIQCRRSTSYRLLYFAIVDLEKAFNLRAKECLMVGLNSLRPSDAYMRQ